MSGTHRFCYMRKGNMCAKQAPNGKREVTKTEPSPSICCTTQQTKTKKVKYQFVPVKMFLACTIEKKIVEKVQVDYEM